MVVSSKIPSSCATASVAALTISQSLLHPSTLLRTSAAKHFRIGLSGTNLKQRTFSTFLFNQFQDEQRLGRRQHIRSSFRPVAFSSTTATTTKPTQQNGHKEKKDDASIGSDALESGLSNEPQQQRQHNWAVMQRLADFASPERRLILQSAATLLVTSSSTLVLPAASGHVLDVILSGDPTGGSGTLAWVATGLFGLTAAAGAGVYARTLWLQRAGNQMAARLKGKLFASIVKQEMAFLESQKVGDLVTRLSQDTLLIQYAVTAHTVSALRAVVMSMGSAAMLFNTSTVLAALSLATLPPLFVGARYVGQELRDQQRTVQKLHGQATTSAEETLGGIATVVQFGAEKQEWKRYNDLVQQAHQAAIRTGRTQALFDGSVHVAANGAILCVLAYGGNLVMQGSITAGDLTGFLMYSLLLAGNVSSLSSTYAEVSKAVAAGDRIFELLDRKPAIPSSFNIDVNIDDGQPNSTELEKRAETFNSNKKPLSVEFRNISFSYPTRQDKMILGPSFSLSIKPGEVLAIVGGSGSGKSTLARLMTRLYDVDEIESKFDGSVIGQNEKKLASGIFINGINIQRDMNVNDLRQNVVGIVSQEPWLLDGTIEENIRYGRPSAPKEEVLEAARLANVLSFTDSFSDGLQTQVGPRGTQLSGGQKQRVAIARLILKDPPIAILDEATSALDAQSEHYVQQAIDSAMKGRTTLSIAHRLSTIQGADRIAVLSEGRVAEIGTFEELTKKENGVFRSLMGRQIFVA